MIPFSSPEEGSTEIHEQGSSPQNSNLTSESDSASEGLFVTDRPRYIDGILQQFITFFISSIIYLLTLRFLVLRFFTSVTRKENIDEDEEVMGSIVELVADINSGEFGRVEHSGSSWQARAEGDQTILKGEQVKIIGRDNITWIVQKI